MHSQVEIHLDEISLRGDLSIPSGARGLILFAHGSGSGRLSPRNRLVAEEIRTHHFATLLMDLLTEEEEKVDQVTRSYRFNIDLLADRLNRVADWCKREPQIAHLPIGYYGASTGAAAALISASSQTTPPFALVSRGGRPDLAMPVLARVRTPTLLIVGGLDLEVIELNRKAYERLTCEKRLEIIEGATHLFEETGKLEVVSRLTAEWFSEKIKSTQPQK